jgi:nicotinamide mononucleotide (NMN) deamidase PncC
LHDVVAELLAKNNKTVALMEGATTGGQIAMWMSENPAVAKVVKSATVIPGAWNRESFNANGSDGTQQDDEMQNDWLNMAADVSEKIRLNGNVDFVLISSPFHDDPLESGVVIRRGHVGVRTADDFVSFDVSMSGNLAIFRQRAARTALNRLRLILTRADSP